MFSTCLHCNRPLARNDEVEVFPVGRRLAFDAAKGRLWVVCTHCARWNLSPLEERWEAVEWCERAYRETTVRYSTGEIGVARRRSGLELVRIGSPLRPEFASWRYGRQLDARRKCAWISRARDALLDKEDEGVQLGTLGLYLASSPVLAIGVMVIGLLEMHRLGELNRPVRGVRVGGDELALRVRSLASMRLSSEAGAPVLILLDDEGRQHRIVDDTIPLLGRLLVAINHQGGSERQVSHAVAKIEHFGVDGLIRFMSERGAKAGTPLVEALGHGQRLALEMAAHETTEREAMEGELHRLHAAWREAEEIATIADGLLHPASLVDRLKRRLPGTIAERSG